MKYIATTFIFLFSAFSIVTAQEATISLDLGIKKYIGKVNKLDRNKYFGLQSSYTNQELNDEADFLFGEIGTHPAKNFFGPEPNGNLQATSVNKIKGTLKALRKQIESNPTYTKYGSSDFILTQKVPFKVFNPSADFSSEASKMAEYVKTLFPKEPMYYELMDEPYENAYLFSGDPKLVKKQIANFYATVARVFKKELPEVKVGGFSSSRPLFELNNFKNWEDSYKLFMDEAGKDIDFISSKLYDVLDKDSGTLNYTSGSNTDAILDLIDTYSYVKWSQVKPHVITEYGLKVPDWEGTLYTPQYATFIVQSLNNFVMSFIDKPNSIVKAVPYLLGKEEKFYTDVKNNPKGNPHPWAVLRKNKTGTYVYTDLVKFYEFWEGVAGERVYISSNNPDIQVHSFYNKGKWYIVCNNLSSLTQTLNFSFTNNDIVKITNYTLRRLYANQEGVLELTEANTDLHIDQLDIDPNETFMMICDVPEEAKFATSIVEYNNYSKQLLQPIKANKPVKFTFENVVTGKGKANIRLSFGRSRAADLKPIVKLNGEYVLTPSNWAGYNQNNKDFFFGTLVIPIPMSYLKEQNEVSIAFADDGGKVSSVIINTEIFSVDVHNDNYIENNAPVFSSHGGNLLNISPAIECKAPKIVDANGKVIKRLKFYNNGETIDISNIKKGAYTLETSGGGSYKFKK